MSREKIPEEMTEEECHTFAWPVWVVRAVGHEGMLASFVHQGGAEKYADSLKEQGFDVSLCLERKIGASFQKLDPDADGEGVMRRWECDDFIMAFAFGWSE